MTAVVSLEFVFDAAADAAVRREWDLLAAADLPSQARHTGASNRPHVTLLVRPDLPGSSVGGLSDRLPLPVTLGPPVLFGSGRTRVLARSVIPTIALLDLHADLHASAGVGDDAPHTVPGEWTPHVTLARRVPVDRVGEALAALSVEGGEPIAAFAVGIRRWDAATRTITHVAGRGTLGSC
ncbi:2'-5' RNA ligase family protein [Microbacterium sp. RURRCA19A]|uniref:2'-5' RNA ligase family protein n=1 Tax=Microbacterium sp. RURRCA19A TaxID=1907391 RepID=UPI00095412FB|nr:2'-5' RNA ligase family protein [Microbacterium sp. RURRCA19A]SIR77284.1 2'-5' RNA ligase [Microbacterium sp. RURRCA19A]